MPTPFIPASEGPSVILVRHGQTEWSRSGRHTSTTDVELTGAGRKQAQQVGASLHAHRFDLVLSSPRRRALETAELAGYPEPEIVDDLAEWDYGGLEGKTTAEISAAVGHPWSLWTATSPDPVPAETADEVGARADAVIARLRAVGDRGGDVLVFAHAHLLRVLAARWIGLAAADGARLALSTGSIGELGFEHDLPVLAR